MCSSVHKTLNCLNVKSSPAFCLTCVRQVSYEFSLHANTIYKHHEFDFSHFSLFVMVCFVLFVCICFVFVFVFVLLFLVFFFFFFFFFFQRM